MVKKFKVTTPMPPLPELEESMLNLYDPTNPDINMHNLVDEEMIRLSGSKMKFFKSFVNEEFDEVYMESRNKVISKEPITVFGYYDPKVIEESLGEFGVEVTNDQIFVFNKTYIERVLNRLPTEGDVIKPAFQNQRYEIFEVQEDSFEAYGVYHLNCHAKLLRDSSDVQDEIITEKSDPLGGYPK